ncbi:MAG: hypothetical protein ACREOH_13755, partial [Candidatus Entotheonellia bacterium]
MFQYLQWLHLADRSQAQAFLDRLFLAYPSILGTLEVVRFLYHCQHWIDPHAAHCWLERMLKEGGEAAAQGMGELLVVRRAMFPAELWITERLVELMRAAGMDDKLRAARIGIAHSVAHLWRQPEHRTLVHGYLLELLQDQEEGILKALGNIFRLGEFLPDQASRELLDTLCDYPAILQHQQSEFVGESLVTLVHTEPYRVHRLCNKLLDLAGMDMG